MKKLAILLVMAIGFMMSSQAQLKTFYIAPANDTISTSTPVYATLSIPDYSPVVSVQVIYDSVSGTVAGTATLEVAHGSRWITCPNTTAYTITNTFPQSNAWVLAPSAFTKYRIKYAQSGGSFAPTATALIKRVPR